MKKFNISIAGILLLMMIVAGSCKKWIDPDMNVDPNKPSKASLNVLLPSAEAGAGYALGGDGKFAASIWMQQMAGGANQPLAYDRYVYTQGDVDNIWKYGLYAGPMMDCYTMIKMADEQGCPYYRGMAKVLMVNLLGTVTDLWGDAPYSAAFQGADNLQPAYDSQQTLYATMNSMLDAAIADFATAEADNALIPGGDDFIYSGDVTLWTKAAYALKARYALHLSKKDASTAYANALTALTNAFAANSEDFEFYFGDATNENNPLFQFNDQRGGDIVTGAALVDSLVARNDPRLPLLIDGSGGYSGSHAGEADGTSLIGPYYASPNSPVPFISYVECKFIEAEALLPTDPAAAATAYNDAVKASLAKFGVSDAAWEAIWANETGATITLEKIIQQKYYALAFQIEVYNDYRRTGFPVLTPAAQGVFPQIPRRYPYPSSEVNYNTVNVPSVTLLTKVWWDQ
jgi:hypothetical protein